LRVHRLAKAAGWESAHAAPIEDLVDYDKLFRLENGRNTFDVNQIKIQ
jgi:hypothetical protein